MRTFTADSTTADVLAGVDCSGQTVLVTGASGGLGAETARALAEKGAHVTITMRDAAKGRAVVDEIRAATANPHVDAMELELSVPASVRRFAAAWLETRRPINVLVNNAGVMACPLGRTAEGWEIQFATNHLGHFLLSVLLAPALRAGAPARVVSLTSSGHRFSPVVFDDVHFARRAYDKWLAYGQSKTANALFALELDRRLGGDGVHANAVHPGAIMTDLGRHLTPEDVQALMARTPGGQGFKWKTVPQGAATSVWAATAPELAGRGGLYLENCGIGQPKQTADQLDGWAPHALDAAAARRLWAVSEDTLGVRL